MLSQILVVLWGPDGNRLMPSNSLRPRHDFLFSELAPPEAWLEHPSYKGLRKRIRFPLANFHIRCQWRRIGWY